MSTTKFEFGPSVTISMPLALLNLLSRVAQGNFDPTADEAVAINNFVDGVDQALTYCTEHPADVGVVHNF